MIPNVYAASPSPFCKDFTDCLKFSPLPGAKYTSETGLVGNLLSDILPVVLGLAGFITVIIIVIAGIQFITSGGNPEAAAAAKNRLTFAIVGFIVIILAFAILQIVNSIFLGSSLV